MLKTVSLLLFFSASAWSSVPQVKVLIGKSLKDVVVHGLDLRQNIPAKKIYRQFEGQKTVNFSCRLSSQVKLPQKNQMIASVTSPTGLVGWESKRFRGELQLVAGPNAGKDGCNLVNLISMEHYISSLLAKEMRADWPLEALKAQSVVARSYALSKMNSGSLEVSHWDLESSEKDQVSGSFHDTTAATDKAARETQGEVLVDGRQKPVMGFFHSKCGGKTYRPEQVWSNPVSGYKSVDCPFCHKHGMKNWDNTLGKKNLAELLSRTLTRYGEKPIKISADALTFVPDSDQRTELRFYNGNQMHKLKKSHLRNIAGREIFPSINFKLVPQAYGFNVKGQGFGHGVGLCQLGAFELARRGYSYKEIIQHYFPQLKVRKLW